jgi:aspartate/tyrosine/aromatic aminotransferase
MSVGAYRDEEGKPYPFPVVKKAQKLILEDESQNFEYSPIDGDQQFNRAAR